MLARLWKPLVLFALTGMLGLGLVGCDSVGSSVQPTVPSSNDASERESLFQLTNDLASRMTTRAKTVMMNQFGATRARTSGASAKAAPSVTLTSIAQVDPPGDTTRASHLTYHSGTVYAGYKALGTPFKGGIDILDASDPANILDVNSLGSDMLDVQEVAYDEDENALYVAGAAAPSSIDFVDMKGTPALLSKVTNFTDPQDETVGLTGRVGKSVVNAPDSDSQHDLYIATDEETLYRFDTNLGNEATQEVQNVEFRSVATTETDVFTVDRGARVYSSGIGSAGSLTERQDIASGVGALAIGRLHARNEPVLNGDRLFLALGSEGLAVLDANSSDVLFRKEGPYYTSLTLHHDDPDVANAPTDLVYGARPNGILDVYRVDSTGIDTGDLTTGLNAVGTFNLSELDGGDFGTSPQVNQVMGVGCNVYVANSNEGVVALEISGIAGCGNGGNQAPTASDDSDQTTEGQSTTTDVLANDTDPDGNLDPSTVQVQSGPSDGSVSVDGSTGEITYTPDSGFTGQDTYTYTVKDGDGAESGEATVTISVNQAVSANDDSYSTPAGQTLQVGAPQGVLQNDTAPTGANLSAALVSGVSHGTLTFGPDGSIIYTPDNGFTGQDTFVYEAQASSGSSDQATVTITVTAPSPPTPPSNARAISFAAFCTAQGSFDADDVTIVEVLNKNNNPSELVSIAWTSTTPLSTVVLKAGPNMYNYDGGSSGGAASEAGTPAGSSQSPSSPCPNGENLIIKDENVGDNSGADS